MQKQTGFTLIEVLVTVVILAVGLLGLAGLQATSLKFNSTAYQRSQATSLAYDIADRMRANVVAARGSNVVPAGAYGIALGAAAPTGTTLAAIDLQEWRRALANTLPSGTGVICRGTLSVTTWVCSLGVVGSNVFTIGIQWDDSRGQDDPQRFGMMTEL